MFLKLKEDRRKLNITNYVTELNSGPVQSVRTHSHFYKSRQLSLASEDMDLKGGPVSTHSRVSVISSHILMVCSYTHR